MATLKQKRKFKNANQAGHSPEKEKNFLPSETVPDQTMSVRDIIRRFASGTVNDVSREPQFTEDMPDLRGYDISQLHDMRLQAKDDVQAIEAELKRQEIIKNHEKEKRIKEEQRQISEAVITE